MTDTGYKPMFSGESISPPNLGPSAEQKMSNLLKLIGNPSECRGCKAGILPMQNSMMR